MTRAFAKVQPITVTERARFHFEASDCERAESIFRLSFVARHLFHHPGHLIIAFGQTEQGEACLFQNHFLCNCAQFFCPLTIATRARQAVFAADGSAASRSCAAYIIESRYRAHAEVTRQMGTPVPELPRRRPTYCFWRNRRRSAMRARRALNPLATQGENK